MSSFKGEFEHSVDNKGRISFPAKLRKTLSPEASESFVIVRGIEPCLYLYPYDRWEKVEDRLTNINEFKKTGRRLFRHLLRTADDLHLDNQNRIALPSRLMEYAGIDDRAVFLGAGDRIEIWSPDKLAEEDASFTDEDFEELFEELFDNNNFDADI